MSLFAITAGIPLGLIVMSWLIRFISGQIGLEVGFAHLPAFPQRIAVVPVIFLVAAAGSALRAWLANRMSVAETIRMN